MEEHPDGEICTPTPVNHKPTTSSISSNVYIGDKRVVTIGDKYNTGTSFDHVVTTGSTTVSIG
jgi:uncharacterized Zn-binding protein involved in type VI secretion